MEREKPHIPHQQVTGREYIFCTDKLHGSDIIKADVLSSILNTDMGMFRRVHGKI